MSTFTPDPFNAGAEPDRSGRGRILKLLGVVLLVGGIVLAVLGVVRLVDTYGDLQDDAVATGVVGDGEPLTFTATESDYSVYLRFEGFATDDTARERAVSATSCAAALPNDERADFRGSSQGFSLDLQSLSSVGTFETGPGPVAVTCTGPRAVEYLVTPGRPAGGFAGIGMTIGGVALLVLGTVLLFVGWRVGRRR